MSNDGCQVPAWTGRPFAHLRHAPAPVSSYRDLHESQHAGSTTAPAGAPRRAATGTWDGPAPKGFAHSNASGHSSSTAAPIQDADSVPITGGGRLPVVGISVGDLDAQQVRERLQQGVRHLAVDLADAAQLDAVSHAVQQLEGQGLCSRAQLFISGSVPNDAHRPEALRCLVESAQRCLSHLDLLLLAWPEAWKPGTQEADSEASLESSWRAMESLVTQGSVKSLGLAHFSLAQVEDVLSWCTVRPSVLQVELHPLLPQRKLVGVCLRKGVQCLASAPLAGGAAAMLEQEALKTTARAHETSVSQVEGLVADDDCFVYLVVLRWNIQRGVPVLIHTAAEQQLLPAASDCPWVSQLLSWRLTYDSKAALDRLEDGTRIINPSWHVWPTAEEGGAAKPSRLLAQQ